MPLQLPQLPNFQTNIPQIDPLQTYGKMLQLKALQGQQQLLPLQVQQAQQQNQLSALQIQKEQQDLASRKALQDAIASGAFNKFAGVNTPDGSGFDAAGAYQDLITKNPAILPDHASAAVQSMLKIGMDQAERRKTNAQAALDEANVRGKGLGVLQDRVTDVLSQAADKQAASLAKLAQDLTRNQQLFAGVPHDYLAHAFDATQSGDLNTLKVVAGAAEVEKKLADHQKAQSQAIAESQKIIPEGGGLSPEMKAQAQKELTVAKAEQPMKLQLAAAEAQAKQLIEGKAEPGYAFNPKTGQTQLTDKTSYLQSGGQLQAFRKVGEKDVRDDTMMTNRLGDVHQKLAEYEQALQKPISDKEKGNIAGLLGTTGVKLGAFGTEIPMDRVNAALNAENLKGLGANARDQLVAYRNMREALLGYKTVLSGSARGSDKQMELLDQAIPIPSITDADYSKRALDSFKGNLHVVGQGLPTLPGVKSPTQIEQEVWGTQNAGGGAKVPGPGNAVHHLQGKKGEIFSNDGQTWYDATGKQIK